MDLFEDLRWRGLAYQWTGEDALPTRLREGPITLYCGFDPTSASLQVGNLLQLTLLRRFQQAGHRPIAVAGGGTGVIGDPSGKSEERNLLSPDELARNLAGIRAQLERFLDFEAGALLVNNADWLGALDLIGFLRDVGKHVSVNVMLARESVKARLTSEAGVSFAEFSYNLLQAYDFVHLHREYGCALQVGGSDQFGNIIAGVDLARRMDGATLYGLTTPLITTADGAKLGKTEAGTIWLDPQRTSPYAFYQWAIRTDDADVGMLLRFLTDLPHEEIQALDLRTTQAPQAREAQRRLAQVLTDLVHGPEGVARAERATQALFGGDLDGLTESELLEIFADVPSADVPRQRLAQGLAAVDAFVEVGLAASKGEARRLLEGGGCYVNNRRLEGSDAVLGSDHLASETLVVLRAGKRSFGLLRARG